MQFEKDTSEVYKTGEMMRHFIKSDGWLHSKSLIEEKMRQLNVLNSVLLEGRQAQDILRDIESRAGAMALVNQWINEIENIAAQAESNNQIIVKDYIERH